MKNVILIIIVLLTFQRGWAQKIEEITHREINVHYNDSSVKANVLLAEKKVHLKSTIDYYWYYNNSIKHNQGDYKGRLLDGDFQVSTKTGLLITKGNFKTGNRSGVWKKWDKQGKLISITKWSKGVRDGQHQKYESGNLIEEGSYKKNRLNGTYKKLDNERVSEKGKYKKGLLHGKQIIYKSDTVYSITLFKKGKEVVPKEKPEKEIDDEVSLEEDSKSKKWWQVWKKNGKPEEEKIDDISKKKRQTKTAKKVKKQKVKKAGEKKLSKGKKKPQIKSKNKN